MDLLGRAWTSLHIHVSLPFPFLFLVLSYSLSNNLLGPDCRPSRCAPQGVTDAHDAAYSHLPRYLLGTEKFT
jgi:hypothetical protein